MGTVRRVVVKAGDETGKDVIKVRCIDPENLAIDASASGRTVQTKENGRVTSRGV